MQDFLYKTHINNLIFLKNLFRKFSKFLKVAEFKMNDLKQEAKFKN